MLKRIFTNREFLLVLSLVLGLVQGQASMYTVPLVLPILAVIMTLSTMMISGRELRSLRTLMAPFLWGIVMNYLILSGATLATAAWLIEDPELWRGFVILAAVPPAVAVIPFTDFLRGNHSYALIGTTGAYLAGLLLMPAIAVAFLGSAVVQPARLVFTILSLIVGPFLISRLILWLSWDRWIQPLKGSITNWCFFVVTYTIVGSNRHVILSNPLGLMPVLAVAVITIICLGFMVEYGARFLKVGSATWRALIFLGTLKNYGLAGGVSLTLFNTKTALPATVGVIVMVLYVVLLQLRARMN